MKKKSTDKNFHKKDVTENINKLHNVETLMNKTVGTIPKNLFSRKVAIINSLWNLNRICKKDYEEFLLSTDPFFTPKIIPWD